MNGVTQLSSEVKQSNQHLINIVVTEVEMVGRFWNVVKLDLNRDKIRQYNKGKVMFKPAMRGPFLEIVKYL